MRLDKFEIFRKNKDFYEKFQESLEERSIPKFLQDFCVVLKADILSNGINMDFKKFYDIIGLEFNVIINYGTHESYKSGINIMEIISDPSNIVDIPIYVMDDPDIDYLTSIIIHEIRHIYDILTINSENDMKSFIDNRILSNLRAMDVNYNHFIKLIIMSLEHELVARNNMIYPYLKLGGVSKSESFDIIKKSFIYESLMLLKNFDPQIFIDSFRYEDILRYTNIFIKDFAGEFNICTNIEDLQEFYSKWSIKFNEISDDWVSEMYNEISLVYEFVQTSQHSNITSNKVYIVFKDVYRNIFNL